MKDRIPLYPGRVKLNPVTGQENTYDMVRADEPTQEGTPLNKASLLKDETAALYGHGVDAVPDDILSILSNAVLFVSGYLQDIGGSKVGPRIETGSYVGTGTSGKKNPCSLTFDFTPKIVLMHTRATHAYSEDTNCMVFVWNITNSFDVGHTADSRNNVTYSGNTISWYNTTYNLANAGQQLNGSGTTYWYTAIG